MIGEIIPVLGVLTGIVVPIAVCLAVPRGQNGATVIELPNTSTTLRKLSGCWCF